MALPAIHRFRYRSDTTNFDARNNFRAEAYWSVFQSAAAEHAAVLGAATDLLRQRGLTWMLSRMVLAVHRSPLLGEEFVCETWPSTKLRGVRAVRDFAILSRERELLASASSLWVMVDLTTRRPQKIPASIAALCTDPGYVIPEFSPELPAVDDSSDCRSFIASPADVDQNEHVNNVVYVRWAMEAFPESKRAVRRLELHYLAEIGLGEAVELRTQAGEVSAQQELRLLSGAAAARASITLQPLCPPQH